MTSSYYDDSSTSLHSRSTSLTANMSGRTWIPIVSVPLSGTTKQVSISRGLPSDVKTTSTRTNSLFSLQITLDYNNGFQVAIPLLTEVINVLKGHVDGTLTLPPYGYFLESDGRHYIILENKNKEVTLSFERNKYRNVIRLSAEELEKVFRFHKIKQFLFEKSKVKTSSVFDKNRPDAHAQEMSLWIQVWTALSLQTNHELGRCDCPDVTEGWPCELSSKRPVQERIKELKAGVKLYAETLKNIQLFRELLGMHIPFDGFCERMMQTISDMPEDNDYSLLVSTVLKQ